MINKRGLERDTKKNVHIQIRKICTNPSIYLQITLKVFPSLYRDLFSNKIHHSQSFWFDKFIFSFFFPDYFNIFTITYITDNSNNKLLHCTVFDSHQATG